MDDSFGPSLFGYFDFTLLFEHSMFEIVPAGIIIFSSPFYIYTASRSKLICARLGWLLWMKLALAVALGALQVASAVLWWEQPLDSTLARVSSILSCVAATCIFLMLYVGHRYFVRSPSFLSLFLTTTLLCDAAITRTYFNRTGLHLLGRLHAPIPVLKFALLILEEVSKRSLMPEQLRSSLGREAFAGFWNKSLFLWINSTLLIGFRGDLSTRDLAALDPQFEPEKLYNDFSRRWANANHKSMFALLYTCIHTIPWMFISIILPRLLVIAFNYAQPFLLWEIVRKVGLGNPTTDVVNALIGATALVYGGRTVCSSWYRYIKNKITLGIRAMLISAVYNKSMRLSADEASKSAALTLMSTDVNAVEMLVSLSYEFWARILEVAAGIAVLGRLIGPSCVFTLIPAILVSLVSTRLSKVMHTTRKVWNQQIQDRVAHTSNALAQLKDIKMLGLGPIMAERLQEKQRAEISVSMADRATWSITMAMAAFVETVTPTVVIAATIFWTRRTEQLSAAEFFGILALVVMVTAPVSALLGNLGYWSAGFASLARIQSYLLQDEMKDYRELIDEPGLSSRTSTATASSTGAAVQGGRRSRSRRRSRRIQFAAQMFNVAVTYDTSSPVLVDVSLNFPAHRKTMIYGTVGCGKTTLLKTLIGEAPVREGVVSVLTKSIAYCSQTPFIRNASIKANIVGPNPHNEAWLDRVLWICALNVDLAAFPNGVDTIVGSDGCNLSGGQKQRISLARALYAKAEILLLDDVFSSLDVDTSSTVRVRLFGGTGILRSSGTTLIMTTSMTPHLVDADHVIGISRGGRAMWLSHSDQEVNSRSFPASVLPEPEEADPVVVVEQSTSEKAELPAVETSSEKTKEAPRYHPTSKYGDFSLYSYFLAPAGGWILVLWVVIVSVAAVAERMPQIYARIWLEKNPDSRLYYLGYAILGVIAPLCNVVAGSFYFYLVNSRTTEALHWKIADTTFRATLDFLTEEDTGSLLNRFSQDITIASQRLPLALMPASWMAVTVLVDIGIIASGAKYAAPIIPVFLLLLAVIQHYYLQTSRQLRYMELDMSKLLYTHFSETSTGITSIRSFQWEHDAKMQLYETLNAAQKPFYYMLSIQQWLQVVLNMSSMAAAVVLVSLALHYTGTSTASSMGLALLSLITFSETMGILIGTWVDTETGLGAIARTRAFAQTTPVERDKTGMHPLSEKWPAAGKVDFSCVSARYQPESETPRTALSNVTFRINAGDKVGIVGRTGSGKSSLLSCLLALVEYSGSISIDDREVRGVPRDVLRKRITTITQSGLQLRGSVRFNLNPFSFECVDDDALLSALDRAGLLWLVDARGGIDADMVDMKLSQGEKQLFQIARAILHKQCTDTKLVLVDEGSASMDEDTERRVQGILDQEFSDCTMLIVSHRSTALESINVLLRLDAGQLSMFRVNRETGQLIAVRPWDS
ncbi:ABC transporter, transmembrane domain, type 1 [Cordyceps fumosorosea ARSEF 2679]|uniref:ABC transporter, transmembrane domain, type 1 n=1 Tax=Cordyceps fumosorosea (strain ARSEF 2679) TaxID=1081104 RepID=A0A167XGH9_CORFA|nr:ABC transporter, transmembrane domain, type 1 [Cordyceps fumosorosea ARSEF 2679]OAA64956.1 ABC transporter, transmembrane domain, type 1 [Cordyceps fumosorosea ARSEF 2679]